MKRLALLALFGVGILAGFTIRPPAPAICLLAVDMEAGNVAVYTSAACPADPNEPMEYQQWGAKIPPCLRFVVVATSEGPKVLHPCKE